MDRLRPYLDHGILELDNNAAKRGMRAYTLIETAKSNTADPLAWLAATIGRIPDYNITKFGRPAPVALDGIAIRPDAYHKCKVPKGT